MTPSDPFGQMTPCSDCPFRSEIRPYLRPDRIEEIAGALFADKQFYCHKRAKTKTNCAGSLKMLTQLKQPNRPMQLGERLGLYDPSKLDKQVKIYPSFAAMAEAMRQEEAKDDDCPRTQDACPQKGAAARKRR